MALLTQERKDQIWRDGILVVPDAVAAQELDALCETFQGWVEESRSQTGDYCETMDFCAELNGLAIWLHNSKVNSKLPGTLTHGLVRDESSGPVRCTPYDMKLPEVPKGTSFFAQQAATDAG